MPNPSATALDDYREGQPWTPGLTGSTGGSGQTYPFRIGSYTKIGSLGFYFFQMNWGGGTLSGSLRLTGFPLVNQANASTGLIVGNASGMVSTVLSVSGVMIPGANYVDLYATRTSGGGGSPLTQSDIIPGFSLVGTMIVPHAPSF